jgi:predicted secreted protein
MSITAVLVVYAVTWFMVFFIVLQVRVVSQGETGSVVPGTPPGAPAQEIVKRKAWITTGVATVIWAFICAVILWGGITVRDFDFNGVLGPAPEAGGTGG